MDFRVSFFFVVIALYLSFLLKTQVFEKNLTPKTHVIYIVVAVFVGLFVLIVYGWNNWLLDVFSFLAVLIYMLMVYLPFMFSFYHLYKKIEDNKYKKAILSLAIMAVCFILIFVCFLADRVILLITGVGYSVFYFLAWFVTILGYLFAYFGYLAPKG